MWKPVAAVALSSALIASAAFGETGHAGKAQPYSGLQSREIKSLSDEDIAELRRGGGWGLALPAELSGRPGPAHLLELGEEIGLSPEQTSAIEEIFQGMRAEAIPAGEALIAAEAALSQAFEDPDLDADRLAALIGEAEGARAALRTIHLSRHLDTVPLLTDAQIARYNTLRGYTEDPCANPPQGHDVQQWRRHNNCG